MREKPVEWAVEGSRRQGTIRRVKRSCAPGAVLLWGATLSVMLGWPAATWALKPPPKSQELKRRPLRVPAQIPAKKVKPTTAPKGKAAQGAPKNPDARPVISPESDVHDFGTVWVGPVLKHTFKIRNDGDAVLQITRVKPSCGCTIAGSYPHKLKPGETGDFPFSVASTKLRNKFEKSITISSNDPARPTLRLRLRGEVKRYVDIVPANVHFGKLYGDEPKERVLKITNNTDKPLELKLGPPMGGNFEAKVVPKTPGQTYELVVTAKPPFKPGVFRKRITLNTNIEAKAQKTINIDVRGSVPQRLDVSPTVLTLGGRGNTNTTGRKLNRVIRFTNYGAGPTKLLEATADDPKIKVNVNPRVEGKSYTVQVEFPAGYELPPQGRKITLKTDDAERPKIVVPVRSFGSRTARKPTQPRRRPAEEMVGKPAPSFALKTIDGRSLTNTDADGRIQVLDFFAANCGFCKKQIPRLEKVRAAYEGKPVRFVAVSQTMRNKRFTDDQVIAKIQELGFHGELATDPDNSAGPLFKATSFPTMVVLGKTGKVEAVNVGNIGDLEKRLKTQLDALIAGKPVPKIETVAARPKKPTPTPKPTPPRKRATDLVGKAAPAFSIKTFDGKPVTNADFAQHPATVLNFVAGNCGYCKKQIPRVEKIRQAYAEKGIRFVNIVQTMRTPFTQDQLVATMDKLGAKLEMAQDLKNEIGRNFGAVSYPTMVVVGKSGKIEAVNMGNIADLEKRLTGQLDALIAGKPVPKFAQAQRKPRRQASALVGKPAPPFSITTFEGKTFSNADFPNHPATVLDFVAANCGYCKKQLPRLEKIRRQYVKKGVRFVSVVQTMRTPFTRDQVISVMDKVGAKLELAQDVKNEIGRKFSATSYPTMVIVGKTGKVEAVNRGNLGDLEKRVTSQLDALIAGKPVPKSASAPPRPRRRPAEELVGKPVPAFSLTTLDGKTITNADLKNHPATVLNFVAPNCGFCKRALPNVEKVRQEYEAKGVRFVNVAQKMRKDFTDEQMRDVFGKLGKMEIATSDFATRKLGQAFKAVSFPTMFVVDRNGKIANVNVGAKANLETLLKSQLNALIKGKPSTQAPTQGDAKKAVAIRKP